MRWGARPTGADADRGGGAGVGGRAPALAVLALLVAAGGCARQEAPPGAEVDNTPPRLTGTRPPDGAVVPDLDEPLVLRFDEPVEQPTSLQRELRMSPAYRVQVSFGFSEVRIRPRGGWRSGAVYYVHVPPPFTDLLGNRTDRAIEVLFSTGPPITETRVEGTVLERISGEPLQSARVLFYRRDGDSIPYTAVQDTADTFSLRALPPGAYRAYGFRDLNGNMRLEARLEPHDSTTFELEGPDDRVSLELRAVEPDSTPPALASASARDSTLVELRFDDPLDPEQDFGRVRVTVRDTATGRTWPVAEVGLTLAGAGRTPAAGGAERADTVPGAAPAAPADTAAGAARPGSSRGRDTPVGAAPALPGAPDPAAGASADTTPLPSRTALARLGRPLEEGGVYRVRAKGFSNLHHLAGGGDTLFVYTVPEDTADAAPDTAGGAAGPDTAAAPGDTVPEGAPAAGDTILEVPPDTTGEAPHRRARRGRRP